MKREFKTSKKNRTNYIYYTAEGTKFAICPGENGVTEADIELLHSMDDVEVDEQRRNDYHALIHFDAYRDEGNEEASDRDKRLADYSTNPEIAYLDSEDKQEHQTTLQKFSEAMEFLLPQQKELFKKVYVDKRSNTDIAAEEGVTEAAIRNRLKKMREKLKKYFL